MGHNRELAESGHTRHFKMGYVCFAGYDIEAAFADGMLAERERLMKEAVEGEIVKDTGEIGDKDIGPVEDIEVICISVPLQLVAVGILGHKFIHHLLLGFEGLGMGSYDYLISCLKELIDDLAAIESEDGGRTP